MVHEPTATDDDRIIHRDGIVQQLHVGHDLYSSRTNPLPDSATKKQQEQSVPSKQRYSSPEPTKKISMEFSDYAVAEIYRTGFGVNRRYEFEYWGTKYIWSRRGGNSQIETAASYSLSRWSSRDIVIAHIRVQQTDEFEIRAGHSAGGWIPRALMRLTDEQVISGENKMGDLP